MKESRGRQRKPRTKPTKITLIGMRKAEERIRNSRRRT